MTLISGVVRSPIRGLTSPKGVGDGILRFTTALPPSVTYSRTGAATAFTVAGVVVPFADNAPQLTDRGLLLEPAATNLLLRSQDLGTSPWIPYGTPTITADAAVAPDGTLTADRMASASANAGRAQSVAVAASSTYTFSAYVKATAGTTIYLSMQPNGGAAVGEGPHIITAGQPCANGYYRVSRTFVTGAGTTAAGIGLRTYNANDDLLVWGMQLELGSAPTSYIPTAGASATRGLPSATVPVPSGKTVARVTYGLSNTVVDVTGLTPGATFDLVTGRPWLGLDNELKTLEWRP